MCVYDKEDFKKKDGFGNQRNGLIRAEDKRGLGPGPGSWFE